MTASDPHDSPLDRPGDRPGEDGGPQSSHPDAMSAPDSSPRSESGEDDIALYDRPMRDAPGPKRWAPMALVAMGVGGVAWAVSMALAGPAAPQRLASPATEIEYSTGVHSAGVDTDLPAPRTPPPRLDVRDTAHADRTSNVAAARTDDDARAQKLAEARRHAPLVLMGADRAGREPSASAALSAPLSPSAVKDFGEETRVATRARIEDRLRAERPRQRADLTLPEGAFIPATLETAIQSDLPGSIRAVVARDVYSGDATRLLIPRGARLVGTYRSGLVRGQSRVFAVWTRLIRPDGVSVVLEAPLTDGAGRAGAAGRRDNHFLERFGASVLLSLIDAGAAVAAADARNEPRAGDRPATQVIVRTGDDFSRAAEIALADAIDIAPTVHVAAGARLQVFVNRDIDFSGVIAATPLLSEGDAP